MSVSSHKYVSAENGGGMGVTVDRDVAFSWETFKVKCQTKLFMLTLMDNFALSSSEHLLILFTIPLNSFQCVVLSMAHNIKFFLAC